jgi:6-phosphogluconolactonase/glucosamine-6-phosphate isomerase/deaminase
MGLSIKTTTKPEKAARFIADSILKQLKSGKRVLFLVTGGSGIAVGLKVAELLRNDPEKDLMQNLTITLTDERYGPVGHKDSNWQQLVEKGFSLPEARLVPVLTGDDRDTTALKFNENLKKEFEIDQYKIGLFGIGKDGHTAGILPESPATESQDLAFGYDTPAFSRITMTFNAIKKLDVAVVWAQGQDKWPAIEDLQKDMDIKKQPAQILKKVPVLTIFTDFKNEN